ERDERDRSAKEYGKRTDHETMLDNENRGNCEFKTLDYGANISIPVQSTHYKWCQAKGSQCRARGMIYDPATNSETHNVGICFS
ncbi:MAG: hypothetical protein ABI876_07840, partial [Bacteroidota bacterium]